MLIGKLAKIAETTIDTIRYYEREGLINPISIRDSGYREFNDSSIDIIKFILNAKRLGFSLKEIKDLIDLKEDPDTNCSNIRNLADSKLSEVKTKIKTLKSMEKQLIKLIKECESKDNKDCPIIKKLNKKGRKK